MTTENLVNVARQIAPTVVVAMGMTFVITTGAIDLSVGSIVGLTAASLALLAKTGNPVLALVLTLLIGAFIGVINGVLTAYGRLQSFIVTLAALTAVRGVALLITQGYSTPIESSFLLPLGNGKFLGLYTPTWMAIVMVIVAWYVFTSSSPEFSRPEPASSPRLASPAGARTPARCSSSKSSPPWCWEGPA